MIEKKHSQTNHLTKTHVLVVEDEEDISALLKINLEADGFKVDTLKSGQNAHDFAKNHQPNIVLLDVMIPDKDGFQVCRELKSDPVTAPIPIIFLTAKALDHNVISGLEIGADDYISKPFSISVLISRINAVLRRTRLKPAFLNQPIKLGGLILDESKMTVKSSDGKIPFNATEFNILAHLMQHPGRVFSRQQLMESCKGDDYLSTERSVDVLMVSIRKKLGTASSLIETIRGAGYKFKDIDT